jgi:selenide,water dikinase
LGRRTIRTVLLAGAGHAHVEVLRAFATKPLPDTALVLATPERYALYSGMLPGIVAGLYDRSDARIDAQRLAAAAGACFVPQPIVGLDLRLRQARCADGRSIAYDVLSLDIGIGPAGLGLPGVRQSVIPVKPIGEFLQLFGDLLDRIRQGDLRRMAIVGGGAGGVELALAAERMSRRVMASAGCDPASLGITILTASPTILPGFPGRFVERITRTLRARGIGVIANARVTAVTRHEIHAEGHPPVAADAVLWATQAAAPPWLAETDLPLDAQGFVIVEGGLDVRGRAGIFAAGDVISFAPRPLPKAGVHAVRQGPVLAGNIRRSLAGRPPLPYRPQREALVLLSTGERHAVATRNGITLEGDWLWQIKDRIDRRWIARYRMP